MQLSVMRIALVSPYNLRRPGGVRTHIAGLGRALLERGHVVEVIAPGDDVTSLDGLPVIACGRARRVAFGGTQIDLTWAAWADVRRAARRGYDVMHFHTIWNPFVPFQLAAAFRGPRVATFHDVAGPATPRAARALMAPASEAIRRLSLDGVIAVSPVVGRYLARGRYALIPNGITAPADAYTDRRHDDETRNGILFAGRLEPRKGVGTLLEAAALLGHDAPDIRIAGDGPLRASLERYAAARRLSRVSFLGEVSDETKWALLRRAAMLVAPSLGGESFGIVLLEAMAAGALPVAADNPGYAAVLAEQRDALLFPAGDAVALAARLRHMLADGARCRALRAWGDRAWRAYDWAVLAPRVEQVYEAATASAASSPAPRHRPQGLGMPACVETPSPNVELTPKRAPPSLAR